MTSRAARGYVLITALMIVMIAVFLATAGLARYRMLVQSGNSLRGQAQQELAARSVAARLVDQFHQAGRFPQAPPWSVQGALDGYSYQADLKGDPADANVFHLTVKVGGSTHTRVLRQESRKETVAYALTNDGSGEKVLRSDLQLGATSWSELPPPPDDFYDITGAPVSAPPTASTNSTAANSQGDLFTIRTGNVPGGAVSLSRFRAGSNEWESVRLPNDVRHIIGPDVTVSADDDHVYVIENSSTPTAGQAPQVTSAILRYSIEEGRWSEVETPPLRAYTYDGGFSMNPHDALLQVVTREGTVAVDRAAGPSTIYLGDGRSGWQRLPPVPSLDSNGRLVSDSPARVGRLSVGSGGRVLGMVEGGTVEWKGGAWSRLTAPEGRFNQTFLDPEENLYLLRLSGETGQQKLVRESDEGVWSEVALPDLPVTQLEIGGLPKDGEYLYKTTVQY